MFRKQSLKMFPNNSRLYGEKGTDFKVYRFFNNAKLKFKPFVIHILSRKSEVSYQSCRVIVDSNQTRKKLKKKKQKNFKR